MSSEELRQLQYVTSLMASYLGHSESLFGMELAGEQWKDADEYMYFTHNKRIEDYTSQECIDTLTHVHEWLATNNDSANFFWRRTNERD